VKKRGAVVADYADEDSGIQRKDPDGWTIGCFELWHCTITILESGGVAYRGKIRVAAVLSGQKVASSESRPILAQPRRSSSNIMRRWQQTGRPPAPRKIVRLLSLVPPRAYKGN
jgi:hypothetical protein